jgi:hypothetical protein
MNNNVSFSCMIVGWNTVLITFKRVRMDNYYSINNMGMIEKCYTPEKSEKEKYKKILRNINA